MLFTILSAIALAFIVCFDRLSVSKIYNGDEYSAWFVSSTLGAILGLLATAIAWYGFASDTLELFAWLFERGAIYACWFTFAGILTSGTLYTYFRCFKEEVYSTTVGLAIAAMPIFVFVAEALIESNTWGHWHYLSVIVTITGLFLYDLATEDDFKTPKSALLPLAAYIFLGSAYMVILEVKFPALEKELNLNSLDASLLGMPFYWLGFATGSLTLVKRQVRVFVSNVFKRNDNLNFITFIIVLEIFGAGMYFFEYLGITKLDATLVALVTGAHVVLVWIFELYLRKRFINKESAIKLWFFELTTEELATYNMSNKTITVKWISVAFVLFGLYLWP